MPEASKPAEQTTQLGSVTLEAEEGGMAAHWTPVAFPACGSHLAALPDPLWTVLHATRVRPLSPCPLYHHSPQGGGTPERWGAGKHRWANQRPAAGKAALQALQFQAAIALPRAASVLRPGVVLRVPAVRAHVRFVWF